MKLHEDMVVQSEIVEQLFEEEFSTAEDFDILRDLEKKLESLGLDPRLAQQVVQKSRFRRARSGGGAGSPAFQHDSRKAMERSEERLNEEVRRTAKVLLNRVGLERSGVEIPRKLMTEISARTNSVAAIVMVNQAIAKRVGDGRKRPEWSLEEFAAATDELPGILDSLVRQLKSAQNA